MAQKSINQFMVKSWGMLEGRAPLAATYNKSKTLPIWLKDRFG